MRPSGRRFKLDTNILKTVLHKIDWDLAQIFHPWTACKFLLVSRRSFLRLFQSGYPSNLLKPFQLYIDTIYLRIKGAEKCHADASLCRSTLPCEHIIVAHVALKEDFSWDILWPVPNFLEATSSFPFNRWKDLKNSFKRGRYCRYISRRSSIAVCIPRSQNSF